MTSDLRPPRLPHNLPRQQFPITFLPNRTHPPNPQQPFNPLLVPKNTVVFEIGFFAVRDPRAVDEDAGRHAEDAVPWAV